jgi:hypothetical protein
LGLLLFLVNSNLTVVTRTQGTRPDLLERCIESVGIALPQGANHLIVKCLTPNEWEALTMESCFVNQYITFVDDDDTIPVDALTTSFTSLVASQATISITNECEVDLDLNILGQTKGKKTYYGATLIPRVIHHLSIINSDYIDKECLTLHRQYGIGLDWFIRCCAATGGAIHIPKIGYYWTQQPDGLGLRNQKQLEYEKYMSQMSADIRKRWTPLPGDIPTISLA